MFRSRTLFTSGATFLLMTAARGEGEPTFQSGASTSATTGRVSTSGSGGGSGTRVGTTTASGSGGGATTTSGGGENFKIGNSVTRVTTDIHATANDECGVATGVLSGSTLTWDSPAEMAPYCRDASMSCTGICGIQGAPPCGSPFTFNNDCREPHPLNAFAFTNGVGALTMEAVTFASYNNQTTTMTFVGTETSRMLDPAAPGCACGN